MKLGSPPGDAAGGVASTWTRLLVERASWTLIDQGVVSSFRKPDAIRFGVSPLVISHQDVYEAVARLKRILTEEIWKQPGYKKVSV